MRAFDGESRPEIPSARNNLPVDDIDRKILAELQRDGRISNVELAERVNLSPSPCLRRLKRLEEAGLIEGYSAVLDRRKVGLGLTVFVELKIEGHSTKTAARLEKVFAAMEEVVACHIVSGPSDFLLEVVVADLEAYEHFLLDRLLEVPGVTDVRSNISISTIKSNGPLPLTRNAAAPGARSRRTRA
jgi:Lrp/AsnC family transcriptional regulator, leucine-responsive regulatory protein